MSKLINRCFKTPSKANDKIMATMIKVEAYILTGRLAEATELLIKFDRFWMYYIDAFECNIYDGRVRQSSTSSLLAWNLYVAFKHIGYHRGCELILSKVRGNELFTGWYKNNNYTRDIMENLFIHPSPKMQTIGNGKILHLNVTTFYEKDIKSPSFFYKKFYILSNEEYAEKIDEVFKLHGML